MQTFELYEIYNGKIYSVKLDLVKMFWSYRLEYAMESQIPSANQMEQQLHHHRHHDEYNSDMLH